ncbi:ferredoxin [Patescibacteria group bacterium]
MKIIQEKEKCIGCGSCVVVCSKYWEMKEDGKAHLKGSKKNPKTGNQELETQKADCNEEAANSCPAQIIHIIK